MKRTMLGALLLFPVAAQALWSLTLPDWLDKESRHLARELNRGVGQSQNPNFIRAEYHNGEMVIVYRSVDQQHGAVFGAVVEDDREAMLRSYCSSSYYRERLEAGLRYRHLYEGANAPAPLVITASACQRLY
ncbi:hypothetical protein [Ferrimonas marina]|uniref:Uncharacterized protein n=1 Tax=Ferrimonas marina TaxID=299255 RepID=A0A1M5YJI6_9GAMM|nr:hypothetical protein [Ferrimonas marina]SHI11673.1 hypothetical protein SAMN02745129_4278 [Ferrimonas marina]